MLKKVLYGELIRKKYFLSSPEKVRNSYIVAGVIILIFSTLAFAFFVTDLGGNSIIAGILTGIPVLAFAKFMPVKTRAGASAYMDILGFEEFMTRAEEDRVERMGDKDLFSKYLPYAIALDARRVRVTGKTPRDKSALRAPRMQPALRSDELFMLVLSMLSAAV